MLPKLLTSIFGSRNDRLLKQYRQVVAQINALESQFEALDDAGLRAKTEQFRQRFAAGETLDTLLPEAFATVREGSKRTLKMRHFDVQLIGGMVLASEFHSEYGHMVELDHGTGLITRYAHNAKVLVKAGDLVKRGQVISEVGTSGRSTGAHLHFEVLVDGVPQDPAKFLAGGDAALAAAKPQRARR